MSEALRLADALECVAKYRETGDNILSKSFTELRRLAGVEAELQQAREERAALLATEQNLREELAALRASLPDTKLKDGK